MAAALPGDPLPNFHELVQTVSDLYHCSPNVQVQQKEINDIIVRLRKQLDDIGDKGNNSNLVQALRKKVTPKEAESFSDQSKAVMECAEIIHNCFLEAVLWPKVKGEVLDYLKKIVHVRADYLLKRQKIEQIIKLLERHGINTSELEKLFEELEDNAVDYDGPENYRPKDLAKLVDYCDRLLLNRSHLTSELRDALGHVEHFQDRINRLPEKPDAKTLKNIEELSLEVSRLLGDVPEELKKNFAEIRDKLALIAASLQAKAQPESPEGQEMKPMGSSLMAKVYTEFDGLERQLEDDSLKRQAQALKELLEKFQKEGDKSGLMTIINSLYEFPKNEKWDKKYTDNLQSLIVALRRLDRASPAKEVDYSSAVADLRAFVSEVLEYAQRVSPQRAKNLSWSPELRKLLAVEHSDAQALIKHLSEAKNDLSHSIVPGADCTVLQWVSQRLHYKNYLQVLAVLVNELHVDPNVQPHYTRNSLEQCYEGSHRSEGSRIEIDRESPPGNRELVALKKGWHWNWKKTSDNPYAEAAKILVAAGAVPQNSSVSPHNLLAMFLWTKGKMPIPESAIGDLIQEVVEKSFLMSNNFPQIRDYIYAGAPPSTLFYRLIYLHVIEGKGEVQKWWAEQLQAWPKGEVIKMSPEIISELEKTAGGRTLFFAWNCISESLEKRGVALKQLQGAAAEVDPLEVYLLCKPK